MNAGELPGYAPLHREYCRISSIHNNPLVPGRTRQLPKSKPVSHFEIDILDSRRRAKDHLEPISALTLAEQALFPSLTQISISHPTAACMGDRRKPESQSTFKADQSRLKLKPNCTTLLKIELERRLMPISAQRCSRQQYRASRTSPATRGWRGHEKTLH